MRRCISARRTTTTPLPDRRQQPTEKPADCAPTTDRARQQVPEVVIVVLVIGQRRPVTRARGSKVGRGERLCGLRTLPGREYPSGMDRAERRRRVGDQLVTSRENEGVLGRRHPAREIVIDEPQDQRGQHVVVRGEDTMPLDGEVTPREGRTSRQLARDVVSEAAGGEQRRLNAQHLDLRAPCACFVSRKIVAPSVHVSSPGSAAATATFVRARAVARRLNRWRSVASLPVRSSVIANPRARGASGMRRAFGYRRCS